MKHTETSRCLHWFFVIPGQAVEMFLDERIIYSDIVKVVEATCETHKRDHLLQPSLEVPTRRLCCDAPPPLLAHVCGRAAPRRPPLGGDGFIPQPGSPLCVGRARCFVQPLLNDVLFVHWKDGNSRHCSETHNGC